MGHFWMRTQVTVMSWAFIAIYILFYNFVLKWMEPPAAPPPGEEDFLYFTAPEKD